jgi:hypothetical protein
MGGIVGQVLRRISTIFLEWMEHPLLRDRKRDNLIIGDRDQSKRVMWSGLAGNVDVIERSVHTRALG